MCSGENATCVAYRVPYTLNKPSKVYIDKHCGYCDSNLTLNSYGGSDMFNQSFAFYEFFCIMAFYTSEVPYQHGEWLPWNRNGIKKKYSLSNNLVLIKIYLKLSPLKLNKTKLLNLLTNRFTNFNKLTSLLNLIIFAYRTLLI